MATENFERYRAAGDWYPQNTTWTTSQEILFIHNMLKVENVKVKQITWLRGYQSGLAAREKWGRLDEDIVKDEVGALLQGLLR